MKCILGPGLVYIISLCMYDVIHLTNSPDRTNWHASRVFGLWKRLKQPCDKWLASANRYFVRFYMLCNHVCPLFTKCVNMDEAEPNPVQVYKRPFSITP